MTPRRLQVLRWLNAYCYIGLLILGAFWVMDGVTVYRPPASAAYMRSLNEPKSTNGALP